MTRSLFIFLLFLSARCFGQMINADEVILPSGTPGTTITSSIMQGFTHPNAGSWSHPNGNDTPWTIAPASPCLLVPVKAGGTTYTDTGLGSIAFDQGANLSTYEYAFASSHTNLSVFFYYAPGLGNVNFSLYDQMVFPSVSGYSCTFDLQDGNTPSTRWMGVESSGGATVHDRHLTPYTISNMYAVSITRSCTNFGAGFVIFHVGVWDTNTWTLVSGGYAVVTNKLEACTGIRIGNNEAGISSGRTSFFGPISVNWSHPQTNYGVPYIPALGSAVPTNSVLPWIPWYGLAGVPGGVPNRNVTNATLNPSGGEDGTPIQNALNAAPSNSVVYLNAGTFLITNNLSIPTGVTLRGAGQHKTFLNIYGGNGANYAISFGGSGNGPSTGTFTTISSGNTQGSTNCTLASVASISSGTMVMITQTNGVNDNYFVNPTGDGGFCNFCDQWSGLRTMGQVCMVTNVSGSTISFYPPLFQNYTNAPYAQRFTIGAELAGVENVTISSFNSGYASSVYGRGCRYCWVKNVEFDYIDGDYVRFEYGFKNEVRDNYLHDTYDHFGQGSFDGNVYLVNKTTGTLVENNLFFRGHDCVMLNWGAAGNVIAYNYGTNGFGSPSNYFLGEFHTHGSHPQMNLLEGNAFTQLRFDSTHGSSSHNTAFRNLISGANLYLGESTPRGAVNYATGYAEYSAWRAVDMCNLNNYNQLLGNLIGSSWYSYGSNNAVYIVRPATSRPYTGQAAIASIGYNNNSDTGDGGVAPAIYSIVPSPTNTTTVYGNLDWVNNAQTFPTNALPTLFTHSLYLTNSPQYPPAFWGSGAYPPFDPTLGSQAWAVQITNLPAYQTYVSLGLPPAATDPAITAQPQNQTVSVGASAVFSVTASSYNAYSLSYQWKWYGTNVTGATSSSWTTPVTALGDNGSSVLVNVTDTGGTLASSTVTLSVTTGASPFTITIGQGSGAAVGTITIGVGTGAAIGTVTISK